MAYLLLHIFLPGPARRKGNEMGMSARKAIESLVGRGILTPEQAALILTRPTKREPCPGCGERAEKLDYVCAGCGQLKAREPRRFWDATRDREAGGPGLKRPSTNREGIHPYPVEPKNGMTPQSPAAVGPCAEDRRKGYAVECNDCGGTIFTGIRYPASVGKTVTKIHADVTAHDGGRHEAKVRLAQGNRKAI